MDIAYLLAGWGWTYPEIANGCATLERLGFDICYFGDDLFPHPQLDASVYDTWTILPAVAAMTQRMKVGSLVSPAGRRHPGLFAKITTGVDQISGGRLVVGMGAGNAEEQQRSLHQPYLPAAERVAMLVEELTILESMWTHDRTTIAGEHYSVTDAICSPKGSGGRRPEVLIALKNARLLAPVAGRFADRANLLGNDDDAVRRLADAIRSEAQKAGRNGDDIVMGRLFQVLFTETKVDPDDVEGVLTRRAAEIGVEAEELIEYHARVASYVGPPAGAAQAILERTRDLGIDEVVLDIDTVGILDHRRTIEGLDILAEHVLPELR
jgi:alkanesulfonate monooxygenase SsuD/methylene tetrahydromethanopterin reductase-like flavin-dependent oxidoreductase (luciferase family)